MKIWRRLGPAVIVASTAMLISCQVPAKEVAISNITTQDVPILLSNGDGSGVPKLLRAQETISASCIPPAKIMIRNAGHLDQWPATCGEAYLVQVASDHSKFEVVERAGR